MLRLELVLGLDVSVRLEVVVLVRDREKILRDVLDEDGAVKGEIDVALVAIHALDAVDAVDLALALRAEKLGWAVPSNADRAL